MSILANFNTVIVMIMSIAILLISGKQQDDLCPRTRSVLCVKDVLVDISSAVEEINDIAQDIKYYIDEHEPNRISLYDYIAIKIGDIRSNLPSKYHYQFMNVNNNINRTGFIDLIREENYAFSYLYNSIKNILKVENTFGDSVDKLFEKILIILRKDILCNYRNIFYVYSETWLSINEINGIQILKTRKRTAPSFLHSSYSIIITKLLKEWMKNVNDFVGNIEGKLSP